jgi:hypothetical protein
MSDELPPPGGAADDPTERVSLDKGAGGSGDAPAPFGPPPGGAPAEGAPQGPPYPPPGYGPPPGYPPPYGYGAGYSYGPSRPTNTNAVIALVLGIISIFTCQLTGPVALFIGARAKRQIRERDEDGSGLATAGMITGAIGTVLLVLVIIFYVVIIILAINDIDEQSSRTTRGFRTSSTRVITTTTRFGAGSTPGGPRQRPASVCADMRVSVSTLRSPVASTPASINDSARTLEDELGPAYQDDVGLLLVDAMSRMGQSSGGPTSPRAIEALTRVEVAVDVLCPP